MKCEHPYLYSRPCRLCLLDTVEELEEELRVYDESLGIMGARLAWKAKNDKLREALENTRSVLLAPGYVYIGRAVSIIDETLKGGE